MSKDLLIHLDHCLTPWHTINNAAIVINNGHILSVGGFSAFTHTEDYHVIELPGCYAAPGFIDTHIYGAGGFDCMHADAERSLSGMSKILAKHGVTTFIPTTQSADPTRLLAVVTALAEHLNKQSSGAVAVGIHVEGPYLSMRKRGAHAQLHVRDIDIAEVERLIATGRGGIKILTFAPELDGALELVELLLQHDIAPSMGHTVADQKTVLRAIDIGAYRCSHLYNGMEPLRQRHVGLAAIAMTDERLWVELIVDGIHIHPRMIDLACRCIPKSKLVGISNANEAAGLKDGDYKFGDEAICVKNGRAVLVDGVLAGATAFLDENFRRLLEYSHLTDSEAVACFTINPARSIGLQDRGEIKPGKRADLVIMNANHDVQMTVVEGRIVYDVTSVAAV